MQVAETVAVLRLHGVAEVGLGVREGGVGGEEFEVGDEGGCPVLGGVSLWWLLEVVSVIGGVGCKEKRI